MTTRDEDLARSFDARAADMEQARTNRDAGALSWFVSFAALVPGAIVLDAGCGPGLVAEAFLEAGCDVVGIDVSAEMTRRASARCARFGARARFEQCSLSAFAPAARFDAAVSRFVLHHLDDPRAFVARQAGLVRPGGVVVALDFTVDPDPARAAWANQVHRLRDRTHRRNLSPGELVDSFCSAGLALIRAEEGPSSVDFDDWFDRGSPVASREDVRRAFLLGTARGLTPVPRPDGGVDMVSVQMIVRGTAPAGS